MRRMESGSPGAQSRRDSPARSSGGSRLGRASPTKESARDFALTNALKVLEHPVLGATQTPEVVACFHASRASVKMQQGQLTRAMEDAAAAVALCPDRCEGWVQQAQLYESSGQWGAALHAWQSALRAAASTRRPADSPSPAKQHEPQDIRTRAAQARDTLSWILQEELRALVKCESTARAHGDPATAEELEIIDEMYRVCHGAENSDAEFGQAWQRYLDAVLSMDPQVSTLTTRMQTRALL